MDQEYRTQLQEQLRMKRRLHHEFEMKKAMCGIGTDPGILIQAEDLAREIRSIELELGYAPTPTIQERRAQPLPPRYVEPAPAFQERMVGKEKQMKNADIEHQMNLLSIHRRSLGILRSQAKRLGDHAPSHILLEISERGGDIARVKQALRDMGQAVDDLPGDE